MINYTDIKKVIPRLPKYIRDNYNQTEILSHALQAYRELEFIQDTQDKVLVIQLDNHKLTLPDEIKTINLITIHEVSESITEDTEDLDVEECVTNTNSIYYTLSTDYLNTEYYKNNNIPLKYMTFNYPICHECQEYMNCDTCNNYFTVNSDRILESNLKDDYLCIWYSTESNKIIDNPAIFTYLNYAIQHKINMERVYMSEENAGSMLDYTGRLAQTWYNKARGSVNLRNIDFNVLAEIMNNDSKWLYFREYLNRYNLI